jgi:Zn-dependent protease with chaperone function
VTERPNVLLAALLVVAGGVAYLMLVGVACLVGIRSRLGGFVSSCVSSLNHGPHFELPEYILLALGAVSALGACRAMARYVLERRELGRLPLLSAFDPRLCELVAQAGLGRAYVTPADRPAAFCFGVLRPKVVLTRGLLDRLDDRQCTAVLLHEAHHLRSRDPLKHLLGTLVSTAFFWVPILRDLLDRYTLSRELAADREAYTQTSREALAGALSALPWDPARAASGIADAAALRVDRLFDPSTPLPPLFRRLRLAVSFAAVLCVTLLSLFHETLDSLGPPL